MITRTLPFSDAAVAEAAELVARAAPVAVPTETVYGLAADATNPAAVAAIYAAKGRPAFNPLIVHVPSAEVALALGTFDEAARALARRHWPGPLTLVVPRNPTAALASLATAGLETIALRVPAHRAMQALLAATGKPLAAPSANASGTISPTRAAHVLRSLEGRVPLILDDGPSAGGLESTILACTGGTVRLLRPGPVVVDVAPAPGDAIEAPGQLAAHYAPSKPLRLAAAEAREGEFLIGFGDIAGQASLSPSGDLAEAAARLFDLLHQADAARCERIAVATIPETGLGIAINDRLRRAAAGA